MVRTPKTTTLLAGVAVLGIAASLLVAPAAAAAKAPRPERQPGTKTFWVETSTFQTTSCWSGAPGQVVVLEATPQGGGARVTLGRSTLRKSSKCSGKYPLAAQVRFRTPKPGAWQLLEVITGGMGWGPARRNANRLDVPGTWTEAERECVGYVALGPQVDQLLRSGPGLSSSYWVTRVRECVPRLTEFPQSALDAVIAAYLVDPAPFADGRRHLASGQLTFPAFTSAVVAAARSKFPGVQADITETRSSRVVVDAYTDVAEQNFEQQITDPLNDPLLRTWFFGALPTTRNAAETAIRTDPRWEYTQRGTWTYLEVGYALLCAFGFTENCAIAENYRRLLATLPPMLPRWPLF